MTTTFSGPVVSTNGFQTDPSTAVTAGGAVLIAGTSSSVGIYIGSGAPTVSAAQGSLYLRTDGSSTSHRVYVNSTGSTTWVAMTSAS